MPRSAYNTVYIMTNFARTVLYIGITSNIERRVWEHKNNQGGAFTTKYKCHYLIHYEDYNDISNAIAREKQLKNWQRKWKLELIQKENPDLKDLSASWYD